MRAFIFTHFSSGGVVAVLRATQLIFVEIAVTKVERGLARRVQEKRGLARSAVELVDIKSLP